MEGIVFYVFFFSSVQADSEGDRANVAATEGREVNARYLEGFGGLHVLLLGEGPEVGVGHLSIDEQRSNSQISSLIFLRVPINSFPPSD